MPNFQEEPWSEAILVTPRHGVREAWNEQALKRHCRKTGHIRYVVPAEDIDRTTGTRPNKQRRLTLAGINISTSMKLTDQIHIAEVMKAMVLLNIATEADVANGTRGRIEKIILDGREENGKRPDHSGTIHLNYPPALLLFRPDKPTDIRFEGIEKGLIPITPSEVRFTVKEEGSNKEFRVIRRQYALTGGYAFTNYKSQGQTIEFVIIDIAKPPSGAISPFGAYVALSRSRG